ncbi:MAG: DNA-binding protein [Patescibacteria group bacterium]|jgi:excisionase family DNA binding protein
MGKTYTVKEVADILGYSTNSIYTFLKEGRITGIRVGRGRYRVSQEELGKLFHLKETQEIQATVPPQKSISVETNLTESSIKEIPSLSLHLEKTEDIRPSLFDWFISLTSIVTGFSMILFVKNFEEFSKVSLSQFFIPIKINLLMAGIGLFVINYLHQAKKFWYKVFYLIISINFIGNALLLFIGKDINGAFYYVIALFVMLLQLIFKQKGTITFKIFITILTVSFPIILFFNPSSISINQTSPSHFYLMPAILITLVISMITFLWACCRKRSGALNWISFIFVSMILVYLSYIYSTQLYWSRSLNFILVIIFLLVTSFWDSICQNYKENQRIIANIFADIILIFFVIISLIWIIQNNLKASVEQALINKLTFGQNIVTSAIDSSKDKIEALSNNGLFKEALEKKDLIVRDELIKNVFIYSSSFRRLVLTDKDGNILINYPQANLLVQDISFRDYFKEVRSTKKTYVSDTYEPVINGVKKKVVSINSPILDSQNNFNGILVGSLDTGLIADHLRQITIRKNKEYFILIDGTNQLISAPENIELSSNEIKHLTNNPDMEESLDLDNKLIQVHSKIKDTNWTLAIRRPLTNIYNPNNATNLLLNLIFIFPGLLIVYLNIIHINKY